jgi:hypothetical protein
LGGLSGAVISWPIAENFFIFFLFECHGVKKILGEKNRDVNISLGVVCAFA